MQATSKTAQNRTYLYKFFYYQFFIPNFFLTAFKANFKSISLLFYKKKKMLKLIRQKILNFLAFFTKNLKKLKLN
ncbi:hypothetical protein DMB92_07325 [Campylobacter sp. MIT 99-7217]|nr:hypothetical protein DMB92_07325 [Campylobacter sp. MIT 99-7217]